MTHFVGSDCRHWWKVNHTRKQNTFQIQKSNLIIHSGLYHLEGLKVIAEVEPDTPWGKPSDKIVISETSEGIKVAFLARHGRGHYLNPSEVPTRANIAALKHIGVEVIYAFSAGITTLSQFFLCYFILVAIHLHHLLHKIPPLSKFQIFGSTI
jgi:hypothetical protein